MDKVHTTVILPKGTMDGAHAAVTPHEVNEVPAAAMGASYLVDVAGKPCLTQRRSPATGELSLAEEGGGELAVSLALNASGDAGFDTAAYIGALQARRFGRWILWSPRMASTHDLVTQNFAKLPVGVVCATDMQFKGKGMIGIINHTLLVLPEAAPLHVAAARAAVGS
nr:uncharacterized protein LOC109768335 [Aegilops tauschii subsp. strangulata]